MHNVDRDSAVGIQTRYGLEQFGSRTQKGQDFLHHSGPALGSTKPPEQRLMDLFLW
jgi:hypothetical protein